MNSRRSAEQRFSPGHPVMAADGLQPPYLVLVVEGYAVGLIGAVTLQQRAQALHALAGGPDIGEHQHHDILFADAAGHVLFAALFRLFIHHEGIGREHPRIGGDGLGGGHAHIGGVDARGCPDAVFRVYAGAGGVAHRIIGQVDLHVRDHASVFPFLILGFHHDHLFHVEMSVVGTGDHGGVVVAGFLSHQQSRAGHMGLLLSHFCSGQA